MPNKGEAKMKIWILTIALLGGIVSSHAETEPERLSSCVACHESLSDPRLSAPTEGISDGVHTAWGITCVDCHGGDSSSPTKAGAKARSTGYHGKPAPEAIPEFCGNCHSDAERMHAVNPSMRIDQLALYRTSIHGRQLEKGDTKVATCISCHGVHGIVPVKDPRSPVYPPNIVETCTKCHSDTQRMAGYTIPDPDPEGFGEVPLPTNQGEEYMTSVHARAMYEKNDLSAPTCTSCHGNHGAAPPGVSHVSSVCRQCHVTQADIFDESPHKEYFEAMEHPECTSCHENHAIGEPSDEMIGDGENVVCRNCHYDGDSQLEVAAEIRGLLDSLHTSILDADSVLTRATVSGMEASEGWFVLREARDGLVKARNVVHSVDVEAVTEVFEPSVERAREAQSLGGQLMGEWRARRKGLVISLLIIALFAVALYWKIKEADRTNPPH
jgi:predicted CXXCH cytochrome family protein